LCAQILISCYCWHFVCGCFITLCCKSQFSGLIIKIINFISKRILRINFEFFSKNIIWQKSSSPTKKTNLGPAGLHKFMSTCSIFLNMNNNSLRCTFSQLLMENKNGISFKLKAKMHELDQTHDHF
jgi:hypothetical protein